MNSCHPRCCVVFSAGKIRKWMLKTVEISQLSCGLQYHILFGRCLALYLWFAMLNSDSYETSFPIKTPTKSWSLMPIIPSEISGCFNHFSISMFEHDRWPCFICMYFLGVVGIMSGCLSQNPPTPNKNIHLLPTKTWRDAKEMKTSNSRCIAGRLAAIRYDAWIPTLGLGPESGVVSREQKPTQLGIVATNDRNPENSHSKRLPSKIDASEMRCFPFNNSMVTFQGKQCYFRWRVCFFLKLWRC